MRAAIPRKSLGRHEESRTTSLPGGEREGESIRVVKIRPEKVKERHKPGVVQNPVSGMNKVTASTKVRTRRTKEEIERGLQRGKTSSSESVLKRKKRHLVLPKELPQMHNLSLDDLLSDGGTPYPGEIFSAFKPFRATCRVVRELKRDHHRILTYLKVHNRLGNWDLHQVDQAGKLSHLVLLCLATFEEDLRKKLQQLPTPTALPEMKPPSTDAELITDFRQERYRAARDKLKLQEGKAPQSRLTPSGDRTTDRRHQQQVLDQDPEVPAPVTFRSGQQGSSRIFKE